MPAGPAEGNVTGEGARAGASRPARQGAGGLLACLLLAPDRLPVLRTLGAELWSGGRLLVSRAQAVFAEGGALTDEKVREQLRTFVQGFAAFAEAAGSSRRRPSV